MPADRSHLDVWRHDTGFWRWRYVERHPDGAPAVQLVGNREFSDARAALAAARTAYPDVPVASVHDERPPAGHGCLRLASGVLVGALVLRRVLRGRRGSRRVA